MDFNPGVKGSFAVTTLGSVVIYENGSRKNAIGRFGQTAYSVKYRNDGRLFAAGDYQGAVSISVTLER